MRDPSTPYRRGDTSPPVVFYGTQVVLGLLVFISCLIGIYSRPVDFLAAIWPANAIMLGVLLKVPAAAHPLGWLAAATGYLSADLLTGSSLMKTLILNAANLVGVGTAYLIYRRLPPDMARLGHPMAMLYMIVAAAAAAVAAGVVGGFANPLLFDGTVVRGWTFWFATEFANYVLILPVMLAAPPLRTLTYARLRQAWDKMRRSELLPLAALLVSCVVAVIIGGPGAFAFPVPALLWCGLVFPVFPTALLTLLFGCWSLAFMSTSYLGNPASVDEMLLVSYRLGASLVAVVPIMVSCVMQSRNELLARLQHLAMHDGLTGVNNRAAFQDQATDMLTPAGAPVGALMIDLDHFKRVNDTHGHAAGDAVLVAVAERIRQCLRVTDALGRLGGEEFAAVVGGCEPHEMSQVAERIRHRIESAPVGLSNGQVVSVTVSVGLAVAETGWMQGLDRLLAEADSALYQAKRGGRNRVVTCPALAH